MAKPFPISFPVRPVTKGLDVSKAPQDIGLSNSPALMNVRFRHGQLQSRNGYGVKYKGFLEPSMAIDVIYTANGLIQTLVSIGPKRMFGLNGDIAREVYLYDDNSVYHVLLTALLDSDVISIDVGRSLYDANRINNAAVFPATGYGDILVFTNGIDGVYVVILTENPTTSLIPAQAAGMVCGERLGGIHNQSNTKGARAVLIFDNRLLVGGTTLSPSEIMWSAKNSLGDFQAASGAGSQQLGDVDWIQTMRRMGEYAVVYKERSIYVGRRSYISDPAIIFDPAPGQGIGLAAPMSVGDLGIEHVFLGWDDVYVFSTTRGASPIGTRIKEMLFRGELGIKSGYIHRCVGAIAEEFDEYWLFIPTGRFPEAENILSNPTLMPAEVRGNVPNGTAIVLQVSTPDLAKLLTGSDEIITGAGIPANTYVSAKGTSQFTMSQNGTAAATVYITTSKPSLWTLQAGTGTWSMQDGGHFGGKFVRLNASVTYAGIRSQKYYCDEVIDDNLFSVLAWVKCDDACTLRIQITTYDSGGANPSSVYEDVVITAAIDNFTPIVANLEVDDADGEQIEVEIQVRTTGVDLDVDAVQCVRYHDGTDYLIDPNYLYTDARGKVSPGFLGPYDVPVQIPLIISKVGPWTCDTVWVYNYEEDSWSCWRIPMSGFGYDALTNSLIISGLVGTIAEQTWRFDDRLLEAFSPTNLIGQPDGQIYEISSKYPNDWNGFLSSPISCYWESKDFDLQRPELDKTGSRVTIYHEKSHPPVSVIVGMSTNSGDTWVERTVTIRTGRTETFCDFFETGPQVRFRVRSDASVAFTGFSVKIIPRGETNAY